MNWRMSCARNEENFGVRMSFEDADRCSPSLMSFGDIFRFYDEEDRGLEFFGPLSDKKTAHGPNPPGYMREKAHKTEVFHLCPRL